MNKLMLGYLRKLVRKERCLRDGEVGDGDVCNEIIYKYFGFI